MRIFLREGFSDEEGPMADEGKLGIIYGSEEELLKICDFFEEVKRSLSESSMFHLHLRDCYEGWNKEEHIDIEVNLLKSNE